jgi:hypothetical protein
MKEVITLVAASLAVCHAFCAKAAAERSSPPNIVFFLVDDMPYAAMSTLGNEWLETPSMDRIIKEGMFFSRAYSENRRVILPQTRTMTQNTRWSTPATWRETAARNCRLHRPN